MEDYYTHRNSMHRFQIKKVDDSGEIQLIDADGLTDESFTKIMRVFPHGFGSHSVKDAHMIAAALGGRRDMLVALGGEHPEYRQKNLAEGQTVLYDDKGNVVFMMGDRIRIKTKSGVVEVESSDNKIWIKPGKDKMVFLGGDGEKGQYDFVMTASGPSINVKEKIG